MSASKSYPRSKPFRPPEAVSAAPAAPPTGVPLLAPPPAAPPVSRRSPLIPLAYGVLFLVGLAAGYVLLQRLPSRSSAAAGDKAPAPAATARESVEPTEDPVPAGRSTNFAHPLSSAPSPGATVVPTAVPVLTLPEPVVEALGSLTASHLYQAYLNIGLLADAVEGEVYEVAEAQKLLATIAGLTSAVEEQLGQLAKQEVDGEDRKLVQQARDIAALLRTQTKELKGYWDSRDKDRAAKFHKARQEAWTGIRALLNIKE